MRRGEVLFATMALGAAVAMTMFAQQPYPPQPYPPQPGYGPQPYQGQQYPPRPYSQDQYQQPQYPDAQQRGQQQQDYPDQPGQPVARLSVITGDASVRRGDTGDWVAAVLNAPLMRGDSISVPAGARAELQLDNGNYVRIGGNTELRISDLEPGRNQIQLAMGLVTYRTLRESESQGEISLPAMAVHPQRLSAVRVEIAPDGSTTITVRHGAADVSSPKGTEHLREGGMMLSRGAPGEPEYQIVAAGPRDAWDGFNDQRDTYLMRAQSNRYLSPDIYGGEDLDNYGAWGNDPQYGNVWTPNVPPGWAPYHDGQWVWQDPYGWTWVDYAPWGWAPFHYGSWYFRAGFGWSWFPGPRLGHYWYHPAMVGFFGFGGVGIGFGFGNVGWVALAPFERFHPWYGPGGFGGRFGAAVNVNLIRNVNIAGTYRNAAVIGGATAVSGADFQRGAFRNQIAVGSTQLRQASLVRGAVPVTPTANNLRFTDRAASAAGPRGELGNQRFFGRTPAAAAQRTPFAQQQSAVRSAFSGAGRSAPAAGASGWQRFGSPNQASGSQAGASGGRPAGNTGWDRFGSPQGPVYGRPPSQPPSRSVAVAPQIVQQRQSAPEPSRAPSSNYRAAPAQRGGSGGRSSGGGHGSSNGHR